MVSSVTSKRYAHALYDAAAEAEAIGSVYEGLSALSEMLEQVPELRLLFFHRQLSPAKKQQLLMPVLEQVLEQQILRNFIALLWHKKREQELFSIVAAYEAIFRREQGEVVSEVVSTRPLEDPEIEQFEDQVKALTGAKTVKLKNVIDKSILGGIVLRIGDKVYDGSLLRRLQQLRQQLLQAQVNQREVNG